MTGILAYGSLIDDPGEELQKVIVDRMNATTPFNVEFARMSSGRKGAPTLVPVESGGAPVDCQILMLDAKVDVNAAKDMLWRRETRTTDRYERYMEPTDPTPNQVLIKSTSGISGVGLVLYVDFPPGGKIKCPTAHDLGARAIESARRLANDSDGITYLNSAIQSGIQTPLTNAYRDEILHETGAADLLAAREMLRD